MAGRFYFWRVVKDLDSFAGSAGGSPASKRYACIKQLKLKPCLNSVLFSLLCQQMQASRPRSRNACLKQFGIRDKISAKSLIL